MSDISLQVRRVTERVRQYYTLFGLRPHTRYYPNRVVVRGSKRLGFDEIECIVAESARGTSVGFYSINQLQGFMYTIPLMMILLLHLLAEINPLSDFITGTGEKSLNVNLLQLLAGNSQLNFPFILTILGFVGFLVITEYFTQKIRLENLKSRFSFYTKDAIWETRDIPHSVIILSSFRTVLHHAWIIAIIYFSIFSATNDAISELSTLYNTSQEALYSATIDAYAITMGLALGIIIAHKSIELRKYYGRIDDRNRISGGLTERRVDPTLFGIESALINGALITIFLSQTFFIGASSAQVVQFLFFIVLGGTVGGLVHQEGITWVMAGYAISVFFTSLLLLFRTGAQPAYAYIVVIQFFFIPIPFILIFSSYFENILNRSNIVSKDWLYDIIPTTAIMTLIFARQKKEAARKSYEASISDGDIEEIDSKIYIQKEILHDKSSNAFKMAKHYFELVLTYSASYDDTQFVVLPTPRQLEQWWNERTQQSSTDLNTQFIETSDRLLWDPNYVPEDNQLSELEDAGKQMVLLIQ